MLLLRQLAALVCKNLLIALVRRPVTTTLRALLLPIVFGWFLSYARNFFIPPSTYGFGTATPVRSLASAFSGIGSTRNELVFVNNGFAGGQIDQIIASVADTARATGKNVTVIQQEEELLIVCQNSLRGASDCIAGVVFHSSPNEPAGAGLGYNYTLRFDGALGEEINVNQNDNDQELYVIPLQHAIDEAIAAVNKSATGDVLGPVDEYPFTSLSQTERATRIRVRYMAALINILAVAFFIGISGIQYQQVGAQATEREIKMAQLLEVMMPNKRRFEPQFARLLSYHIAFSLLYAPGWIIMAIILKYGVFAETSLGVVIIFHLLTGLALASFSLFAAAFFKKAQLSGITCILLSLILAIIAQVYNSASSATVYATSFFFPSMNYTYFIILMARFEAQDIGTNLVHPGPDNPWTVRGIVFWIFLIIQIVGYPILAAIVERVLWGTASGNRHLSSSDPGAAIVLNNFSKRFEPNWFERKMLPLFGRKKKETVVAVDDLSLKVLNGQISVLLGANGSGKSTTLDAIAGLTKLSEGSVSVDFKNGIALCPQQNVLWKDLTVYEHVNIFNRLKNTGKKATKEDHLSLIGDCDLQRKVHAKAASLSGGQKRKLQLASMFTGDSKICLIDECSSGIDPLARRKIQNILLEERSRSNRTMIFTSHYLDEADIADDILIMSKGKLKMQGTAPEIKQSGQYRIHLYHTPETTTLPEFENVARKEMFDQTVYSVSDASKAASLLAELEGKGFSDYTVSGPTVEDAFLKVAEEMVPSIEKSFDANGKTDASSEEKPEAKSDEKATDERIDEIEIETSKDLQLSSGNQISPLRQGAVLFRKRYQVFLRNVWPNLIAFALIPIGAGLAALFLQGFAAAGCSPIDQVSAGDIDSLTTQLENHLDLVVGPSSALNLTTFELIFSTLVPPGNKTGNLTDSGVNNGSNPLNFTALAKAIHTVDTLDEFNDYITLNYHNVTPGGFFLGNSSSPSTLAYTGNAVIALPVLVQNMMNTALTNIPISTQYQAFDIPWQADQGNTLQFVTYFGLVLCVVPAFFSLYPTLERLRHVRGLHYSNGVTALPLWLSYIGFDFSFVLLGSSLAIIIVAAKYSAIFYSPALLWLVFLLYGLCATLFGYVVSLYARSQLGSFAIAAAYQTITGLLYLIAYLSTLTYSSTNQIDNFLHIVHFTLALIFPTASLFKSLFISLNVLSVNCRGVGDYETNPGGILAYGGPILYLIIQSVLLFMYLVWWDSGKKFGNLFNRKSHATDDEDRATMEPEVAEEVERVSNSTSDGLRVLHLTKAYGKNVAVDDASFGVKRGEVFGLLGPNGAGKSTTISVIRGDLKASNNGGDVFIENFSLRKKRASARQHLSACPQHDAMDRLTVTEHLEFYARIRGVADVAHNVTEVLRAVGLEQFKTRMGEALSGGNKRKLSLGIALMGNPAVMLLDEPSSGMDVAAKRVMWRTLESVVPGRSIVLTTHSMEEADRLCNRAGILAKRLLAVGTCDYLRKKHGDRYYVHMLLKDAPYTPQHEADRVRAWALDTFPGAEADEKTFHGQLRFSVPVAAAAAAAATTNGDEGDHDDDSINNNNNNNNDNDIDNDDAITAPGAGDRIGGERERKQDKRSGIAALFETLEREKARQGFAFYSVSQTTLDQVFLSIVGKHNVEEENAGVAAAGAGEGSGSRSGVGWKRVLGRRS